MSEPDPKAVVAYIEQHCENSPPNSAGNPDELWNDFDPDSLDQEIADLWKWGILEAELEGGEQYIKLSEFGAELEEKDLCETYINAKLGKLPEGEINENPAVRVLNE